MSMDDEYGAMTADGHTYVHPTPLVLESGQVLQHAQLRYQTYGRLNASRDNVLVVCHALTGNASLHAWWGELLGDDQAFDTSQYFVVCCNILGSCYGSTNPTSIDPTTGQEYGLHFPDITVRDTVRLQLHLLETELHITSVVAVIGGSFGGMQALEYIVQAGQQKKDSQPQEFGVVVQSAVVIGCGVAHTAWQIGISDLQRNAIYCDPNWKSNPKQATQGLALARQIGMVSYRSPQAYRKHFGRRKMPAEDHHDNSNNNNKQPWCVSSYLEYQGEKFLPRFDPITYVKLTEQMDTHDVTRGRSDTVLSQVTIPVLVMGLDSDLLYPLDEQKEIAEALPMGRLRVIHTDDGHDGFLLEQEQVSHHIREFLASLPATIKDDSANATITTTAPTAKLSVAAPSRAKIPQTGKKDNRLCQQPVEAK